MSKYVFELPQLTQYVDACHHEQFLTKEECDFFHQIWDLNPNEPSTVSGSNKEDNTLRKSRVISVDPSQEKTLWFFHKTTQLASSTNAERYGFELHGFYEPLQLATYEEGDFFDWHADFGSGPSSNRKLSITIQLSDPNSYEGGDLEFMINKQAVKAPRNQGTAIVFPSFVLHRVTPVTKGCRRSIVGWVHGPPFR